MRHLL
jgi:hypothetical protein